MPSHEDLANFPQRAAQVREIAKGIFDNKERKVVLDFVVVAEKMLAKEHGRHFLA